MGERQTAPQRITVSDFATTVADQIDLVARRGVRVIVEQAGAPVAALVPVEDVVRLDRLDEARRERERRFAVIDRMRAAFAGVPAEEIERETARAVAEARAELAAERENAAAGA